MREEQSSLGSVGTLNGRCCQLQCVGFGQVEIVCFTFPSKVLLFHSVLKTVRLDVFFLMRVWIGQIEKF